LRNEYEKYVLRAPRTLRSNTHVFSDAAWARIRRVSRSLAAACLRIRWESLAVYLNVDFPIISFTLRMRILVQLLDERVRTALTARQCFSIPSPFTKRRRYWAVVRAIMLIWPFCDYATKEEETLIDHAGKASRRLDYKACVMERLRSLRKEGRAPLMLNVNMLEWEAGVPGPRVFCTAQELFAEIKFLRDKLPVCMLGKPVDPETCWQCGVCVGPKQVCSQCNFARYCSRDCALAAWMEHKENCDEIRRHFTSATRRRFEALLKEKEALLSRAATYSDLCAESVRSKWSANRHRFE
jgi:hypothetical protein